VEEIEEGREIYPVFANEGVDGMDGMNGLRFTGDEERMVARLEDRDWDRICVCGNLEREWDG
jgi:hypothetical protein